MPDDPRRPKSPHAGVPITTAASRVTPPNEKVKRAQTSTERDMGGLKARAQRGQSPAPGTPEFVPEEITGNYEGDQLAEMRARRKPDDRFELLETKHDKLDEKVDKLDEKVDRIEVAVATIGGKMDMLPTMFQNLQNEVTARRETDHLVLKQTMDISTKERTATIDGKLIAIKSRWKIAVAITGGLFSTGVLIAIITLFAKQC